MHPAFPTQLVTDFFKAKAAAYVSPMGVKAMQHQGAGDFVLVDVRLPGPQLTWRIRGAVAIPGTAIAYWGGRFGCVAGWISRATYIMLSW